MAAGSPSTGGFNIVDACASSEAVPYPGGCETIAPAYRKLIGLNLVKDFRKNVRALFGGVRGCTHITEMLGGMPTAAIQTFAGEMQEERDGRREAVPARPVPRAETSSETVRRWYPSGTARKTAGLAA